MRTVFQVIAALVVVAVLAAIGIGVYNAGVSAGLAESIQALPSGEAVPYAPYAPYGPYAYGWGGWHGPGFGFFGIHHLQPAGDAAPLGASSSVGSGRTS